MHTVTLTSIDRIDRTSKAGKQYTSVQITTKENGDIKYSGFHDQINKEWQIGDTVSINIEQKGEYWNFTAMPANAPAVEERSHHVFTSDEQLMRVLDQLTGLNLKFGVLIELLRGKGTIPPATPPKTPEYPTEPNPDDIPF